MATSETIATPQKTTEYYKSLQPTQLIAERGPDIVVINPGSCNVRVGLASWKMPAVIPHCIAWHTTSMQQKNTIKGSISDQTSFQVDDLTTDREEVRLKVESVLGVATEDKPYEKCEKSTLSEVQWTSVKAETFRRYICGDEALRIPASEPYFLRRPMCRGRLNVSQNYTIRQVCDDLYAIWDWILQEKLSVDRQSRRHLSAVLVVPDTLDNREVKEILTVLLKDLEFQSVVVHQECIAATFGNGVSSACVVQMGGHVTSVTCVEDGVSMSTTHRLLPYGGEDISRCLLWVQQQHNNWPPIDTNPSTDSLDLIMLERLKEIFCIATSGKHIACAEVSSCTAGQSPEFYKVNMVAINVPPCGLFYPSLFALEERKLSPKLWHYSDHEDMLVDPAEMGCSSDLGSDAGIDTGDAQLGLHEAIVDSICSLGRYDLKSKFFSSILLVGGVASTLGLTTFLEDKILPPISRHERVDKVEIFPFRVDPSAACWKGGVLLGILDFSRDGWIHREDWLDGGPRPGSTKKYKDSISLHGQALWYNAVLD